MSKQNTQDNQVGLKFFLLNIVLLKFFLKNKIGFNNLKASSINDDFN